MRSNRKIIFGLLLILGAFGFYRAFRWLSGPGTPPRVATGNTPANGDPNLIPAAYKATAGRIAEARVNIPANTIVTPDMFRMVSNDTTKGYVTDIESQASGFVTRVPLSVGSRPRLSDQFGNGGDFVGHVSEVGIAGLLRPGTRAMVIPVANKPTLHDLVRIGNSVDIIGAFDGQESRTLIQDVRVLGVDLSGNDYPNVNVAMRGPFKADAKQNGVRSTEGAAANAAPTPAPTVAPNAPRPDPAITLEVTPVQASRLQLALASNATLDYLIRPALPGNRSAEIAPNPLDADNPTGQGTIQTVSVTKRQIAPYAESRKAAGGGGGNTRRGGGGGNIVRVREQNGFGGGVAFPPSAGSNPGTGVGIPQLPPPDPSDSFRVVPTSKPVPTPTQNYVIPIYGDGRITRQEVVPLPDPSK